MSEQLKAGLLASSALNQPNAFTLKDARALRHEARGYRLKLRAAEAERDQALARAKEAERFLFTKVVELEGSISGEHGIGFAKAPYLPLELSQDEIALMKRVKAAFDPNGILNPGKIFP